MIIDLSVPFFSGFVRDRGKALRLTHLLVLFHTSAFSTESFQPQLLVLGFPTAQHTQHLQRVMVTQGDGVSQRSQVRMTPVRQIQRYQDVCVKASTVVQKVPPQDILFTEDQLVVEQEAAALLRLPGTNHTHQLTRMNKLRAPG